MDDSVLVSKRFKGQFDTAKSRPVELYPKNSDDWVANEKGAFVLAVSKSMTLISGERDESVKIDRLINLLGATNCLQGACDG